MSLPNPYLKSNHYYAKTVTLGILLPISPNRAPLAVIMRNRVSVPNIGTRSVKPLSNYMINICLHVNSYSFQKRSSIKLQPLGGNFPFISSIMPGGPQAYTLVSSLDRLNLTKNSSAIVLTRPVVPFQLELRVSLGLLIVGTNLTISG